MSIHRKRVKEQNDAYHKNSNLDQWYRRRANVFEIALRWHKHKLGRFFGAGDKVQPARTLRFIPGFVLFSHVVLGLPASQVDEV